MRLLPALLITVAAATSLPAAAQTPAPAWLFPIDPQQGAMPATAKPPTAVAPDSAPRLRLAGSDQAFTTAELADPFFAPDWHPQSHAPMPPIVARGRATQVMACGYCHLPAGQGRPENAPLAGLPAAYIEQQLADMRAGLRRADWHGFPYMPAVTMGRIASAVSADEVAAAADYFAAQRLPVRVRVFERRAIPKLQVAGWLYAPAGGGSEVLGERLFEVAPDLERHERRDETLVYTAYVPPGSLRRGGVIAQTGAGKAVGACVSCHGPQLRGVGLMPPLAGRSPSYLLRQLYAFRSGARAAPAGQPMRDLTAALELADLIAVAAYAASLPP